MTEETPAESDVLAAAAAPDESSLGDSPPMPALTSLEVATLAEQHISDMQQEIQQLQAEIRLLRRRDETVNLYMQRVDEEMRLAAKLQRDFLPKTFPEVGPLRFHALFRPAGYVSGDLYDVVRLDETHVGFYVADAVGHGMPAALLTMFMKRALVTKEILTKGYRLLRPSETMHLLNQALLDQHLSQATFATALYGTIDTETLACNFARAGHPCPLILRKDGTVESPESEGGLLGIFEDEQYDDGSAQLRPGDRLFVFTDGVEVSFSSGDGVDTERWREEVLKRRHLPSAQLLQDLAVHLDTECASLDQKDDLTIIIADIAGA